MAASSLPPSPLDHPLLPWPGRARLCLPTLYCLMEFHRTNAAIYRRRAPIPRTWLRRLRLREMFVKGGVGAFLAGQYLHRPSRSWPRLALYARLYAYWSNFLILADAASDLQELAPGETVPFLQQCRRLILGPILAANPRLEELTPALPENPAAPGGLETTPAAGAALHLARQVGRAAAACLRPPEDEEARRRAFSLFAHRLATLLQGQSRSLRQQVLDDRHHWRWYVQEVLDAKFLNILLAPLVLLAPGPDQEQRRLTLEQGFLLINALFLHRQLLDDLLDMEADLNQGILSGPAYLLLSWDRPESAGPPPDPLEPDLANLDRRLMARLRAVSPECLGQEQARARKFRAAWPRDPRAAAALLLGSRTLAALLAILQDPQRLRPVGRQLQDLCRRHPAAQVPLSYYYHSCSRSYRRLQAQLAGGIREAS